MYIQGTRAHWSSENTTMHLVRSTNGVTFIDEQRPVCRSIITFVRFNTFFSLYKVYAPVSAFA